jgi:hypothetical protein
MKKKLTTLILLMLFQTQIATQTTYANFSKTFTPTDLFPVESCTVYLNSSVTSSIYYDDLMIRPVASSIGGYVYIQWDELSHIIGNNGLATHFEYDNTGRLVKTYSEVIDDVANGVTAGFKLSKSNTYNNKYMQ